MDDISIQAGKCHTITFQSSSKQANFRKLLHEYFKNRKQEECNYIKILDTNGRQISGRDFYFIPFDCSSIYLKDDRDTSKQLREILYHYLEYNPDLLKDFIMFNEQLSNFFGQVEIVKDHLKIDFQPSDKTITQLIRSLDIIIEYKEDDFVPNHIMRDFLISALLDMNMLNKDVFLFVSYPETDVGIGDFMHAMDLLKELNVTTIIISSHRDIITTVNEENIFLVHENGTIYDIIMLREELLDLKVVKEVRISETVKVLAYQDFKQDYFLLDDKLKSFLMSNKM